jgi:hypothetical protein
VNADTEDVKERLGSRLDAVERCQEEVRQDVKEILKPFEKK